MASDLIEHGSIERCGEQNAGLAISIIEIEGDDVFATRKTVDASERSASSVGEQISPVTR
jgi:hypothetical protein